MPENFRPLAKVLLNCESFMVSLKLCKGVSVKVGEVRHDIDVRTRLSARIPSMIR